ncbi:MAG: sulfurtransferase [Proteobacteria bacterium]|nr:sulfurtransferase [Burkholderiales bacterium]
MMTERASPALVSPAWVESRLRDPCVRLIEIAGLGQEQMQSYAAGHVPGATCWEWKHMLWDTHARDFPSPDVFATRLGDAGISRHTTVVFYGEPVQFGIYAWWTFRYCGHTDVKVLDGGRHRWAAEGRALSTDTPVPMQAVAYPLVERNESMRIGRDAVLAALGDVNQVILDGRSPEEFNGHRVGAPGNPDTGALRYGRIPGARHLMFEALLNADKSFKPAAQIRAALDAVGATENHDIITYCRMSHRATVLYFALTELAGRSRVRVYDGSWTEWGNLVGVPVER